MSMAAGDEIQGGYIVKQAQLRRGPPQKNTKVFHTKCFLKKKIDDAGKVKRFRACFIVCGNEETANDNIKLFAVLDFTAVKFVACIAAKQRWRPRHAHF